MPLTEKENKMTEPFRLEGPTGAQPPAQSKAKRQPGPSCYHQLGLEN